MTVLNLYLAIGVTMVTNFGGELRLFA